jgi:3-isopropylmalate dehydrogenase
MKFDIVLLPGDGIGPEVLKAAQDVLMTVSRRFGHSIHMEEYQIGGCAIDSEGTALPKETLQACRKADAILLGAVGGPKWDDPTANVRPEQGLLGLRKELELFANLRPVTPHPRTISASPLRPEKLVGVDMLVVRELTSGIYFGEPRLRLVKNGVLQAIDTMMYNEDEVRRVADLAFQLASERKGKVSSVDKANVLESSRLWRQVVSDVGKDYPEITLEHLLVDAAAMHILNRANTFDVILTANMFGDILTDEASMLTGSMGLLPSASIGAIKNTKGYPLGLYEPIHGSAPDIAGLGIANPIGAILSAALMLRYSFGLEEESQVVEKAVEGVLDAGYVTADLVMEGQEAQSTEQLTEIITAYIKGD